MNLFLFISGIVAWAVALIYGFYCLGKRLRRLQEENDTIYQDEIRKRYSEYYKFNVGTEDEALINWVEDNEFEGEGTGYFDTGWNPSEPPDEDMYYGHMNF